MLQEPFNLTFRNEVTAFERKNLHLITNRKYNALGYFLRSKKKKKKNLLISLVYRKCS